MFDGKTDGPAAAMAILNAESTARSTALGNLKADGKDLAVPNPPVDPGKEAAKDAAAGKPADFMALVEEHMKAKGCKKSEAISAVAKAHPAAHQAYIAGANTK
jgi:hypothetical protein